MKLHRTTRTACGLMGAMAILSIIYYALMIPPLLRRPKPQSEYYGQGGTLITSSMPQPQWGRRSSTVCGPGGCSPASPMSPDDDSGWQESWVSYSDAWVYQRGGQEYGRIYKNGSTTGFTSAQPSWYPSGMPQQFQRVGQVGQLPLTPKVTGELPPPGTNSIGQPPSPMPPTGVNPNEVAKDKARVPGGVTINGHPETEAMVRDRLSDSAKAQGLKDYIDSYRLVVVGRNELERKPFEALAKPWVDASKGKLIYQTYDAGDWHIKAHENAVQGLPDYEQGKPFSYLQKADGTTKAIMFTPSELAGKLKQLRPDVAPDFDAAKARAATQVSNDWLIWASAAFVGLMGLIGAVTSKPQQ